MSNVLMGAVNNGRRAQIDISFYKGEVGVCERGDVLELAWFGRPPTFSKAVEGLLDGQPILIVDIQHRELAAGAAAPRRGPVLRAITAVAELVQQPE